MGREQSDGSLCCGGRAHSHEQTKASHVRSAQYESCGSTTAEPRARQEETRSPQQMHETELMLPEHILQAATLVLQSQDALMDAIIQLGAKQGSMPADLAEAIAAPAR